MSTKQDSLRIDWLALRIADHACRADIEIYAHGRYDDHGCVYDLLRPVMQGKTDAEGDAFALARVQDAAKYIRLRGGGLLGWRMEQAGDHPDHVRFVTVEPQS